MITKVLDIVKNKKGVKIPQGRVWAGGTSPCTLNSGGTPAKRAEVEARAGREFIFPTPLFLPAPPERQNSASGFSRKKVRILFKTDSHFVKFRFPASLGASPLASANEFSSNFQTSQSFLSPEGRPQSGNFLPKSDYKFNQIKL